MVLLQMLLHNIINVSMYSRCKPVLSLTKSIRHRETRRPYV